MKRTLYIKAEIEAPELSDPMWSLSDAALWLDLRLTHGDVVTETIVYKSAEDMLEDEAEDEILKRMD